MKTLFRKGFLIIISGLFTFFGCSSLSPVTFDLAEERTNSASISFTRGNPRVSFVYYENRELPEPEKKTYWDPIVFPSGIPLEITVHAYYFQASSGPGLIGGIIAAGIASSRAVDISVLFLCPPLEAGKEYVLTFRKLAGAPGRNILVLTDKATRTIIYQQEFERS